MCYHVGRNTFTLETVPDVRYCEEDKAIVCNQCGKALTARSEWGRESTTSPGEWVVTCRHESPSHEEVL